MPTQLKQWPPRGIRLTVFVKLRRQRGPGVCLFCPEKVAPFQDGRWREMCRSPDCLRAYGMTWRSGVPASASALTPAVARRAVLELREGRARTELAMEALRSALAPYSS